MASLLELYLIEALATKPVANGAALTPEQELRAKVRSASLRAAEGFLDDQTTLPPTDPQRTDALGKIYWSRQTINVPELSADALLRLLLADAPATATVNDILGLAENQIQNIVNKMVPRLSKDVQAR